jgi:flagellar biosynthesis/type III secretory pathway chaperone
MARADSSPTITLLDELVRSLHEESDALVAGDLERLTEAAARKNDVLARLAPELKRAPETQRRQHDKVLRAAQHMHERNARIFAVRMSMNRSRAEVLLNTAGGGLYAADGAVAGSRAPIAATRARV